MWEIYLTTIILYSRHSSLLQRSVVGDQHGFVYSRRGFRHGGRRHGRQHAAALPRKFAPALPAGLVAERPVLHGDQYHRRRGPEDPSRPRGRARHRQHVLHCRPCRHPGRRAPPPVPAAALRSAVAAGTGRAGRARAALDPGLGAAPSIVVHAGRGRHQPRRGLAAVAPARRGRQTRLPAADGAGAAVHGADERACHLHAGQRRPRAHLHGQPVPADLGLAVRAGVPVGGDDGLRADRHPPAGAGAAPRFAHRRPDRVAEPPRPARHIARREFDRCQRTGTPLFFITFDIDHFKSINDRYGHSTGDAAICHVTRLAARALRGYDALFRIGGEEFAVLVNGGTLADLQGIAQRLRELVAGTPIFAHGLALPMTVSVGLAAAQPGDTQWEEVLKRADEAMYHAKQHGRNHVSVHGVDVGKAYFIQTA
ncbi:diguanylate cyclase [Massilia norwichensis]|uniref:diguanylate cyclase n=2 Tax=Massilia norwichensis TaxID=1442366 RepID=A0ABT2A6M2_9BURK|nr:diguanylate cyclase [Massilia norwichensis]